MRRTVLALSLMLTFFLAINVSAKDVEKNVSNINNNIGITNNVNNSISNINFLNNNLNSVQPQVKKKLAKKKVKKLSKVEKYKEKLFHLGVVTLSDSEEEYVKIYDEPNKKSKVEGYLTDGGVMTVIEQDEKWYRIKSGKIYGYISTKNVAVDDDVETLLLENESVEVRVVADNVKVTSKAKGSNTAVGMGYKDRTYPVTGFSNDGKKIRIQRTESIAGWVPVSTVEIEINAEKAMTKKEYEEYRAELERKRQEELQRILNAGLGSTGDKLLDNIIALLSHNESGNFMAARNGLKQFAGEKTITVGAWQWYGERAHNLLRSICLKNSKKAEEIIKNSFTGKKTKQKEKADKLYSDIKGSENWESTSRTFTKEELIAIKALLGSSFGVEVQRAQIKSDVYTTMSIAKNTYSLTNKQLITYFCDLFWQSPENARKIVNACIQHYKGAKKFCEAKDGLKYMHGEAMKNSVMNKFSKRRNYTYSVCRNIEK